MSPTVRGTKPADFSIMSFPNKFIPALVLGLALACSASGQVKSGQPFPALTGHGLEGTLPDTAGHVVLIDFWATWCAPCKASFPAYTEIQREFAPRGFVLLAVSVDQTAAPYEQFIERFKPAFPTVRDGKQKLISEVRVPAMPTSYLLDRHGIVRSVHSGYHGESTVKALRDEINRLLEEKS